VKIEEYLAEATSGDYDHPLQTTRMKSRRRGTCGLRIGALVASGWPAPKRRATATRNKPVRVALPVAGRSGLWGRLDRGGPRGCSRRQHASDRVLAERLLSTSVD
jgi:hypothetical protein